MASYPVPSFMSAVRLIWWLWGYEYKATGLKHYQIRNCEADSRSNLATYMSFRAEYRFLLRFFFADELVEDQEPSSDGGSDAFPN